MNIIKRLTSWFMIVGILVATGYGFFFLYEDGLQFWLVILLAIYSLNVVFAIGLFSQKRHSGAKLSWVIIMIILPFFGHAIFILFGRRFKDRVTHNVYIKGKTFEYETIETNLRLTKISSNIFAKQSVMSNRGVYDGDINFFNSGIEAFKVLFEDMRNAKKFINIHFYIIHPGEIYDEFKSILIQKAKEGVTVRFIVDDFGRWAMPWYEIKELEKKGVQIQIFGKVTFPFIGSQNGYRTHRKMVIVDGELVHTGGMNIGDEYANLDKKYGNWVDFQGKVTGKVVRSYSLIFIMDWKMLSGEELDIENHLNEEDGGKSQIIIVEDSPIVIEPIIEQSIISWILHARKSIKLATPYFIPTNSIMSALKTAAMSGVEVTIFIPGKADKKSVLIASKYWAKELTPHGVHIKQVNDMLIHSKIGIFDNEYAYAGTANIDMRSIYSQFEMISLMHGPAVKGVNKLFNKYDGMSKELSSEDLKLPRMYDRLIRVMISIFAPLM